MTKDYDTQSIRNIALVSHSQAGKTSLVDALIFAAGANSRLGKIDEGTSISDYNEDERERKISINASILHCNWKNKRINFIDTPGYADFIGEVISSLKAVDAAVLVIDATSGIEVGTEKVWQLLEKDNLPRIIYISKLDKENADFFGVVKNIKESFGRKCVLFQFPVGGGISFKSVLNLLDGDADNKLNGEDKEKFLKEKETLIEQSAEADDSLLEKYLEDGNLSISEINKGISQSVISGKTIPIFCGVSIQGISTKELLDAIISYLPSPDERGAIGVFSTSDTNQKEEIEMQIQNDFSGLVFKTIADPYVGQLSVFRVFSGNLSLDSEFFNIDTETKERITQLYILHGKEQISVDKVRAGDIAAVAKLKNTFTGNTICDSNHKVKFPPIDFPEAVFSSSVKPKTRADEEKISLGLSKLANEDSTFKVSRDPQTKELIISGMGELHLDIMINRLKQKFGVDVEKGTPKVPYKETVVKSAKVQGKYKKQSGGKGQYGDVWLEIRPLPREEGFEFENKIVGGAIPRNFIPAVEKGIKQACSEGALAGCPITDIKTILYDGSYHSVDSSDMAFQIAGSMALKKGIHESNPILLEPIMVVEIIVPEEYMGQISGNLSSRRGRILGMESKGKNQVLRAQVPQAEMFKYVSELKSMTGGKGSYSMKFSHYQEVPHRIAQSVIEKIRNTNL